MGRPSRLNAEIQEKIVSAIRAGNYANVAAAYAGINVGTFYEWLQKGRAQQSGKYAEFHDAVKLAESQAEIRAVAMVQRHMDDNWAAAMTYLERKHPDRWGRRDRLSVEIENKQSLSDLLGLSKDDIDQVVDQVVTDGSDVLSEDDL